MVARLNKHTDYLWIYAASIILFALFLASAKCGSKTELGSASMGS
jgi:hypothetical protein